MIGLLRADDREPIEELGLAAMIVVPPLRAPVREDLRRRLRAAATEPLGPRPSWAWPYALAAAAVILLFAGVTAPNVAVAAAGDPLLDVKLTLEQVERSLAADDAALVMVLAAQADRRHDELQRLLAEGSPNVARAVGAYVTAIFRLSELATAIESRPESDRERAALAIARGALARYRALVDARDLDSGLGPARPPAPTTPTDTSGPLFTAEPSATAGTAEATAVPAAAPSADIATAPPAASPQASAPPRATPAVPPQH